MKKMTGVNDDETVVFATIAYSLTLRIEIYLGRMAISPISESWNIP